MLNECSSPIYVKRLQSETDREQGQLVTFEHFKQLQVDLLAQRVCRRGLRLNVVSIANRVHVRAAAGQQHTRALRKGRTQRCWITAEFDAYRLAATLLHRPGVLWPGTLVVGGIKGRGHRNRNTWLSGHTFAVYEIQRDAV